MMAIQCCKNCVAPKRHPGCHGHCTEYLTEKEQYEKQKAQDDMQRRVRNDIYIHRANRIAKALKHHRRK